MREPLLKILALNGVSYVSADVQFIEFWEEADEFAAEIFTKINLVSGKKFASSFQNRYERAKRAAEFYQDSGPCDSSFTDPTYQLVEMKRFDPREAMATNLVNLANMLDGWMDSYACLEAHDRVSGKKIRVPRRSVKDIRKLSERKEYQETEYAYEISAEEMDFDEALAYCYLRGSWLAEPAGDKNRFGALREALSETERYWFDGDNSCTSINGEGRIQAENCQEQLKTVCESGHFTDKCYAGSYKTCVSSGDPHYTTFDGEFHHFQGTCEYTMVEVDTVQYPNMPWFKVRADLAAMTLNSPYTWNRGFVFEFQGKDQAEGEAPRYTVNADGWKWLMRGMVLEDRELGQFYTDDYYGNPDFQLSTNGNTVTITTWFGVTVLYQAGSRLDVTVPDCYQDNVDGLCGNWDGIQYDEFDQISSTQFGNWKAYQEGLTDWAEQFEEPDDRCRQIHDFECEVDLTTAIDECLPLDSNNAASVFASCDLDKSSYHTSCILDTCEDDSNRCESFKNYAQACMNPPISLTHWLAGTAPTIPDLCNWASDVGCEETCGENAFWNGCASACSGTRTCQNQHLPVFRRCGFFSNLGFQFTQSMCVCEPGFILEFGVCIPESDCGCTIESGPKQGHYLKLGDNTRTEEDLIECTSTGLVITPLPCDEKTKGVITVHSDPYIAPIDGVSDGFEWGFHGNCRYNLAAVEDSATLPGFNIDIKNRRREDWSSGSGSVIDEIWIEFHSNTYTLGDSKRYSIYLNNIDNSNSKSNFNARVLLTDNFSRLQYDSSVLIYENNFLDVNMTVSSKMIQITFWNNVYMQFDDDYWNFEAHITPCYKGLISGLSGNWNDDQRDEERMEDDYKADSEAFGELYVTEKDGICTHGEWFEPCNNLTSVEFAEARERCHVLKDGKSPSEIFSYCTGIDKQPYFDMCLFNTCVQDDFACGHINDFAQKCLATKHPDVWYYDEICSWPSRTGCEQDCPGGQVFKGCSTECIEARTCNDVVDGITNKQRCGNELVRGPMCGCPHGQVWHGDQCIDESECPTDCASETTSHCRAWGDPHYTTLDGETHHFQGACKYTFIESEGVDEYRNMPAFKIIVDQRRCGANNLAVSCVQGFTFEFFAKDQLPNEIPRFMLTVDNELIVLEDRTGVSYTSNKDNLPDFFFEVNGNSVKLTTWFDVDIEYSYTDRGDHWGYHADLKAAIPDCYQNQVSGLCGNYNSQLYDEFSRLQSLGANWQGQWRDHQLELNAWANDFSEPDPRCREVHDIECDDIDEVSDLCVSLDKTLPGGPFNGCPNDKSGFYIACLVDACENRDSVCQSLKAYATECMNAVTAGSTTRTEVCEWARELGCEETCGENMEFQGCASVCSASRTCMNRHVTDDERCGADVGRIESMCVCQPGFILDNGECIPEENCGCVWDHNGVYYQQDAEFANDDERCTCTSTGVQCTPIPCNEKTRGECIVHSDPYIKTLDGPQYMFHGNCRYNLMSVADTRTLQGFNIEFKSRRGVFENNPEGSIIDEFWIEFHEKNYSFGDEKRYLLYINDINNSDEEEYVSLEFILTDRKTDQTIRGSSKTELKTEDYEIELYSRQWELDLYLPMYDIDIKYTFDWWTFTVNLPQCYKEQVSGMCGDWNENVAEENSMKLAYENDSDAFGELFVTQKDGICSHGTHFEPCEDLSDADYKIVTDQCFELLDENEDQFGKAFGSCHIDKQPYYDTCLFNSCIRPDIGCGTLRNYAQECLKTKNIHTTGYWEVCKWPKTTGCEKECPETQSYKGCTSACHEARTCDDIADGIDIMERCKDEPRIQPMCGCGWGKIWHNEKCIDEDECPRDAVSTSTARCRAWGDPHYTTFDGGQHHFQGACKYTFVESGGNSNFRNMPAFKIDVDQRQCGDVANAVTCINGWTFEFPGRKQPADEVPRYIVTLMGSRIVLDDRQAGSYDLTFENDDVLMEINGNHFRVKTWFGADLNYFHFADLRVDLPDYYMNHVFGLCGNWNGIAYDEFSRAQGLGNWRAHQTELVEWANDFAEPDPRCREVHDFECDDIDEVTDMCVALDKNILGGPFNQCTVDKDDFHLACLVDTCEDRTALCSTLKAYATECLNNIATNLRPQVCSWANELGCEEECGENMVFDGCANVCSARRTCANRHLTDEQRCGDSVDEIDSMCVCQPGYIFDNGRCIEESECGCFYLHCYYEQGEFRHDDEICECTSTGVTCRPLPCEEKSWGYCRAHNDPYIKPFDGWNQLSFHGDCRYNLASAEDTVDYPGFNVDTKNRRPWLPFAGAVTDELWFDFHAADYTLGDEKRYSLHIRNLDDSSSWRDVRFEFTLTDNLTGVKLYDAVSQITRNMYVSTDDFYLSVTRSWLTGAVNSVYLRAHGSVYIRFSYYSWSAYVGVSNCYQNQVTGLCGNFNGDNSEERDYITQYALDSDAFGDQFQTDDDNTCSHGDRLAPCEDLSAADYDAAADRCDAVRQSPQNSANRNIFAGCEFFGDRTPTYEACLFNSCIQDDLHCGIIGDYAFRCLEGKSPLSADYERICNWAAATGCEEECPVGQVYKGCTTECREQKTCEDIANGVSDSDRCQNDDIITAMCGCADGKVLHNGECIEEEDCPKYAVSTGSRRCTGQGDPHYTTFDGGRHHFQGACKYTFVESEGDSEFFNMPAFKIDVDQRQCGNVANAVSCINGWTFEFPGQTQGPEEVPRYIVTLMGRNIVLDDRQAGNYDLTFENDDVLMEINGNHFRVKTWFGADLNYFFFAHLRVDLPDYYMNHVFGLCGNWNGIAYDEFSRAQGLGNWRAHQTELVEWANDFAEPDPRCREVHDFECDDIDEVTDMCVALDKNILGGPFNQCTVDKDDFHLACLVDTCEDRTALCSTLKAYATECLNNIATNLRPQVCSWANELGCEEECGENMVFDGCANVCSARRTCANRHLTDEQRCGDSVDEIDSMCVCQPGYIFDNGRCIEESECGCFYLHCYYEQGEFRHDDEICECTSTGVTCRPLPCEEKSWGYCRAHNDPYIKPFDGWNQLSFHGDCRYNLASAEDTVDYPGFNVDTKNRRPWLPFAGAVTDELWFDFHAADYTLGDEKRYSLHIRNLDDSSSWRDVRFEFTLTDNLTGVKLYDAVSQITRNMYVSTDDFYLSVTRSWLTGAVNSVYLRAHGSVYIRFSYYSWSAYVGVSNCYQNQVTGLCGNFNGDNSEERDYITQYALDSDAFGDQFQTDDDNTCSHGDRLAPCEDLSAADYDAAADRCDAVRQSPQNSANRNIFAGCEFLGDRTPTYEACLFNSCIQDDLHCGIIGDYAFRCLEGKSPLSADYERICNWAAATGCEEECPVGQVYKGCTTECREQKTCEDIANGVSDSDRCQNDDIITAMCGCADGKVLHNGECIEEEDCPKYAVSTGSRRCTGQGDPHYTTFDGGRHHFQGACKYTFVESEGDSEFFNMPAFKIDVDQRQCGNVANAVSCINGWTFEFPGQTQGPEEVPRYIVTLMGRNIVLDDRQAGNYDLTFENDDVLMEINGNHFRVKTWFGADLNYFFFAHLRVDLPDYYMNHVFGLCGNWNGIAYDEFSRAQGLGNWRAHQTELVEWANDFAEPDPRCREVHDFECDDIDEVTDMCVALDKNILGGPFNQCTVDKDDFHLACLVDTCEDRTALCSTLKAYATECLNNIATNLRPQVCSWANELGCEEECGENMVFDGCANVCSARRTCANRHLTDEQRCGDSVDEIDSMCVCQPGYIFDNGRCIEESECGCFYLHCYYEQGEFRHDDEICECTSTGVTCRPLPCEERKWAFCKAHNDPYIKPFDGYYQLGFHGDCRYNLASAEDTIDFPGFNVDTKNRRPWLPFVGAVTDELWFDFHAANYVFGDEKRYSVHIRNIDDSAYYRNTKLEITFIDNLTGERIFDAYSKMPDRTQRLNTDDYYIYLSKWRGSDDIKNVYIRVHENLYVRFEAYYWKAKVGVSSCYQNKVTGLCGNFNDDTSEEREFIRQYALDSDAFGEQFKTDDDTTCSHGDRIAPCEDLSTAEYNEAADRCDPVRQSPNVYTNRNIFAGCEFLGDRTPTYEACLFNSCIQDDLHCGIMRDYASSCLEGKDPLSADYDRICNWAAATGCEEECPAGQVYKGCGNMCHELQTCEDVVRGVSKENRCEFSTLNFVEGMCGCPEGKVLEGGVCVPESSCGCLTEDDDYVELNGEIFTETERCTCGSEGLTCEALSCPCDGFDTCTNFVCATPRDYVGGTEGILGTFEVTKNYELGYEFTCEYPTAAGEHIGPHIWDGDFTRVSMARDVMTNPDTKFARRQARNWWEEGNLWFFHSRSSGGRAWIGHENQSGATFNELIHNACVPGFNSIRLTQSYDENFNMITKETFLNGELLQTRMFAASDDMYEGTMTASLASPAVFAAPPGQIRNFYVRDTSMISFVGETPESASGENVLMYVDLEKSFKIQFEIDCGNSVFGAGHILDIREQNAEILASEEELTNPEEAPRVTAADKPFLAMSRLPGFLWLAFAVDDDAMVTNHENFNLLFSSPIVQNNWDGDLDHEVVLSWVDQCPGDSWSTFVFEHIFDDEAGLWTSMWSINGLPVVSATYASQNFPGNYQLGFSNNPAGSFISDVGVRNFFYKELASHSTATVSTTTSTTTTTTSFTGF